MKKAEENVSDNKKNKIAEGSTSEYKKLKEIVSENKNFKKAEENANENKNIKKVEENANENKNIKKAEENANKNKNIKKAEENNTENIKKDKSNERKTKNAKALNQNPIAEIALEAKDNLNLNEKKQNKNEKALLSEEDIEISHEKLEKIKDEISESKKVSKEKIKNSDLRKKLVRNLVIGILITIYFLFIDLGINSIPITVYTLDLKTFAVFIAIISIVIFEKAYKKDANYIAIHGVEMVVVGIETLLLLQLYSVGNEYFNYILLGITLGMLLYYLIKCLIIYIRYKTKGK